ncbi:hypothetical protein HN51_010137 [Arachis hypogaea]|uniref:Uncharacterized protein LOC107476806 n=1 Tax=Arachis duranensis TaxID=130453 RepID=A0A6P4CK10_ARADU|nr:uncharacterized protein LOC107476806 [Arachis duranensis]XP_025669268.2 uncharacterized protein LOC112769079 [Arachis hypogaea]QHO55152.1 uncharacterized protein DS421_3g62880 [Arachis hypogaea]QHO55153.1 uncharacterized protein DS421_3g62880 [Arachis hypogaea]
MSRKLFDQLKSEESPYHPCHEVIRNEEDSTWSHLKHGNRGRESDDDDELVKYMSNLPGYLERGKKNREKVLNVGVLDWTRLEQWQYSHKYVSHKSGSRTSTSSNASSSVSTDRLSCSSNRGNSHCASGQRKNNPSLQAHFMASPMQSHSEAIKSSRQSVGKRQNFTGRHGNPDAQSRYVNTDGYLAWNKPSNRLKGCDRKYLGQFVSKESDIFPNDRMYEAALCGGRMGVSIQDGGLEKRSETLRRPNIDAVVQGALRKSEPVPHFPREVARKSHCAVPDMHTSLSEKFSRMSFSEKPREFYHKEFDYDVPHSCPLPDELSYDNNSQYQGSGFSSTDLESIKVPASTFSSPLSTFSSPMSVKMSISPSRVSKTEEKKPTIGSTSSANEPHQGSDPKVMPEKSRSSSPFRRLSLNIGHTSKGSTSKEAGHMSHLSSTPALKSNMQDVRGYVRSNTLGDDKACDAGRRKSSPLRRLLDPLLKPKTAKSRPSMDLAQKDSVSTNKNYISVNGNLSSQKADKALDRDYSSANAIDSSKDKHHVASATQAFLRIAVRNGMPLFTFGVDNTDRNILAATVKNLSSSGEDECNCIYTFYTFREAKKKNGSWMIQAGKNKGSDYISHAVAQMKVSDKHGDNLDSYNMKEFVLVSVKLVQGDDQVTDYQPNDELAAIVLKTPKSISFINDAHQDPVHATVLLPSGVHSLPSKGGPSSLIERWRSGGSCDCGGWDLACQLKILSNENQARKKPKSSKAYFADKLELFLQGNEQEHRSAFSLTPLKHGMYSVAFDSSLSLLQAFSICIALMKSKMPVPYELSGSRSSIEGKIPRETTLLVQNEELKAFGKLEDIPASYVSYPPHSPVGRV